MNHPPPSSSSDHLSPPVSSPSSETEKQLFIEDDLEFRTVTTLLALLESRENVTLDNFEVTDKLRPYLKMLTGFSSLLVRHHEILAILPKRSARGTELFLSAQGGLSDGDELSPSSPSSPPSSPLSLHHFLARSPRNDNPPDASVELLDIPDISVGTDILSFIVDNWNQSFDSHVKVFETLLNICLASSSLTLVTAWSNLGFYSFFQSVGKVQRRFHNSNSIKRLSEIDPASLKPPSGPLSLTKMDNDNIRIIFFNANAKEKHSALFTFVDSKWPPGTKLRSPEDPALFLAQFHELFNWFLGVLSKELSDLVRLRKQRNPPEKLSSRDISVARRNIEVLGYFAWASDFFMVYIRAILNSIEGTRQVVFDAEETGVPGEKISSSERDMDGEEEEDGLDIATEFETDKKPQAGASGLLFVDPFMSQLRLITSNTQHLSFLRGSQHKFKGLRMKFRILKYPRSDKKLKPWREVITSLFSAEIAQRVIETLCEKGKEKSEFKFFLPDGPALHFKGQAHCEAVLGCLYTLANDGGDASWAKIPSDLLHTIKHSYNLLALSKRCCPICATIIDLLSAIPANRNRPPLQALSRHSIIFPCAFPYGLPRDARVKLLKKYKAELKNRLLVLVEKERRDSESSEQSGQSEPVSSDEREYDRAQEIEREIAEALVEELKELQGGEKTVRWAEILRKEEEEVGSLCWFLMGDIVRIGLRSPTEEGMRKG